MPVRNSNETNSDSNDWGVKQWFTAIAVGVLGIGILSTIIFGWQTYPASTALVVICIGVSIAGSALLVGALLGLLFGIPRSEADTQSGNKATNNAVDGSPKYRANTNLEQISDWLTKILVGVGLTQVAAIRTEMLSLAGFLGGGLGGPPFGKVYALVLLTYFLISGFLLGYLWTRIVLPAQLRAADIGAIGERIAAAEQASRDAQNTAREAINKFDEKAKADAAALSLISRQLQGSSDVPVPSQDELNEAISKASPAIKVQAFVQARTLRLQSEGDGPQRNLIERTIPIFRALIYDDSGRRFHRNHAQLAYALKAKTNPDLGLAEEELTAAIEIRGDWRTLSEKWLHYELNRAILRILRDPDFKAKKPAQLELRDSILDDLRAAANGGIADAVAGEEIVEEWLTINGASLNEGSR
jgi:hypothetical protein